MTQPYSQFRAMMAITKASLKATFRSPQAIFFSLFFPIVLIWIFGSLGRGGTPTYNVALEKNADTTTGYYRALKNNPSINFVDEKNKDVEDELKKGRITAIIDIQKNADTLTSTLYNVHLRTSSAAQRDYYELRSAMNRSTVEMDRVRYPNQRTVAAVTESVEQTRPYKYIDFFLPGMIGFALIGSAVFGVAFGFYLLRESLVLKRMYSTPVQKGYIILGESIARVIFNLTTVVVLIGFGHYAYGFYLAHGWITFVDMLVLSFIALLVFMGFGFFISAVAKNQNVIPIYANLFMFPQYFLSGTFFPRTALPAFLQPILKFLPLTAVNDAMRNVAFEGASLASTWPQILILAGWGVIIYAVTARIFRWE
jgi:ABC-2 type transport system permease protein